MKDRRSMSSSLSSRVVQYLRQAGHSQAKIARMLGVSEPFISLVKSRERGLTLDHLDRLSNELGLPLGALLIAVSEPRRRLNKQQRQGDENLSKLIRLCDSVKEAILRAPAQQRRRRRAS